MANIKLVLMSDSHGKHHEVVVPECDILLHSGDVSMFGKESQTVDFFQWFDSQKAIHKVLVGGNHDLIFEKHPFVLKALLKTHPSITYLEDSGITIKGLNIWGSPVQPWFYDWAFNRKEEDIQKHWNMIPENVDILLLHSPPYGILDQNLGGMHCGCPSLKKRIQTVQPTIVTFGHIHEGYGTETIKWNNGNQTMFFNSSVVDRSREVKNKPWIIELELGDKAKVISL